MNYETWPSPLDNDAAARGHTVYRQTLYGMVRRVFMLSNDYPMASISDPDFLGAMTVSPRWLV